MRNLPPSLSPFVLFLVVALGWIPRVALNQEVFPNEYFEVTLHNGADFALSPGVYILHQPEFDVFRFGELATPSLKAMCENGRTGNVRFYLEGKPGFGGVFIFYGGAEPKETVKALLYTKKLFPLLTAIHKVDFSDDTCVVAYRVPLFTADGQPIKSLSIPLEPIDGGTRINTHLRPPAIEWLSRLWPRSWSTTDENPQKPVSRESIFAEAPPISLSLQHTAKPKVAPANDRP